jgi:Ca2+-binding RTX toxin-like protein
VAVAIINGDDNANGLLDTKYSDTINGYGGNDRIVAIRGPSDTIYAGAGDDTITILSQYTLVDGGDGYDKISFQGSNPITLDLASSSFEDVTSGGGNDHLDASSQVVGVKLDGRDGDDTLIGSAYDDTIRDLLGTNSITGGAGNDNIFVSTESTVTGGAGIDHVAYRGNSNVTLDLAAASIEHVTVDEGNDTIDGSAMTTPLIIRDLGGSDVLTGGSAGDVIYSSSGNDIITGGGGDDHLTVVSGNATISGGAGNDVIKSGVGSATIAAGSGNDQIFTSTAFVSLDAGTGFDQVFLTGSTAVTLDLGATGIEYIKSGSGDDTLDGSSQTAALTIFGNQGNDTITGGALDDFLQGGSGDDYIDGGSGIDTASYHESARGVFVSLLLTGSQNTEDGQDTLIGIENLDGSAYSDTLIGNEAANVLDGGAGADLLIGGRGDDSYVIDNLSDRVRERAGEGTDTVLTQLSYELPDFVERLVLGGTKNLSGIGNAWANTLLGNPGDNYLAGAAGDDHLFGAAGRDYMLGEDGIDLLSGGSGDDYLDGGDGDDRLNSGSGDDVLLGGTGNDILDGGDGNDRLFDGRGSDTLVGDAGADRFVFGEREGALVKDRIMDFSHSDGDLIGLAAIDADTGISGNQAFHFIGGSAFSGAVGELRYEQTSANTLLMGDTNGDGHADFTIVLAGLHDLQASDFVL